MGIVADFGDGYGRAIARGVMRYANLQRRWLLFKDLLALSEGGQAWPDLDGVILTQVSPELMSHSRTQNRCVVACSGSVDPADCPVVSLDDVLAGAQAAEHLISCQIKHFAVYGVQRQYPTAANRLKGFREAVQRHGGAVLECPIQWPSPHTRVIHEHRPGLIRWLKDVPKPIGIMAFDDTLAHDLAAACLECGVAVPDHVAIVGINNDDLLCESAWPPLSSVDADFSRMGYLAAEMLDRMISRGVLSADERRVVLPPLGVVRRQSTSVLAIEDPYLAAAVHYIREHACDPCTVEDVLAHVPVHRRWLERRFVSQLNRTPKEEITRVRIETAMRLLVESRMPVFDIASRCGFGGLKSFYTAFGKVTDTTPAAYRRRART